MGKIELIKDLVEFLNKASDAYYNTGDTIIGDHDFDRHMEDLRRLEKETGFVMASSPTQRVGYEVKSQLEKVRHTRPMLSLDKCHSAQELIDFAENDECYLSVKCDGLTTRLIYENGELVGAETRGNGEVGQNVLFHVKQYDNVPLRISTKSRYVIDGESVILYQDFLDINNTLPESERFANPRNLASGTLSNLDSNITKQRHMQFIAWRVIEGDDDDSHFYRLKNAKQQGFEVAPMWTYVNSSKDIELLGDILENLRSCANKLGLPMDGIVMAKNSHTLAESMGRTTKAFRHSIAYKFEDKVYETKLECIDWTLGRTGILTPTAVFKSVEIDGTEVTRASLHNISIIKALGLTNQCTVYVFKANQIIPQIQSCENDGYGVVEIPTHCPVCNGLTAIKKDNESEVLICTNPNCSGKRLAKLTHFVSRNCMNIDGLSEAKLDKLISLGYIKEFSDIYVLSNHYEELIKIEGFGPKSVKNLLSSIENSRNVKLEHFLNALGIPNIGLSAAKTISKYFNGDINQLITAHMDCFEWEILDDFGAVMANSIDDYLLENINMVQALANEMNFIIEKQEEITVNPFNGKIIAVTGKLNHFTRNSINEKIESLGAKAASSVTTKTDFLLTNEASGSSKYKKAVELGINIITENQFINMIGG